MTHELRQGAGANPSQQVTIEPSDPLAIAQKQNQAVKDAESRGEKVPTAHETNKEAAKATKDEEAAAKKADK